MDVPRRRWLCALIRTLGGAEVSATLGNIALAPILARMGEPNALRRRTGERESLLDSHPTQTLSPRLVALMAGGPRYA